MTSADDLKRGTVAQPSKDFYRCTTRISESRAGATAGDFGTGRVWPIPGRKKVAGEADPLAEIPPHPAPTIEAVTSKQRETSQRFIGRR